jgi:methionyl-tRNA synthetase
MVCYSIEKEARKMNKYNNPKMARDAGADKCDVCGRTLTEGELIMACQENSEQDGNTMLCAEHDED